MRSTENCCRVSQKLSILFTCNVMRMEMSVSYRCNSFFFSVGGLVVVV